MAYNLATRSLSDPVYIMSGGGKMDDHNWPAITIDGGGILHVLANGHQDPANYAHSLKPRDISARSAPRYVLDPGADFTRLSYATLNCDRAGNLYSVMRNSSGRYNNRLSFYSQSNLRQLYPDTWTFDLFFWPDREKAYYSGRNTADGLNLNTGSPQNQSGLADRRAGSEATGNGPVALSGGGRRASPRATPTVGRGLQSA